MHKIIFGILLISIIITGCKSQNTLEIPMGDNSEEDLLTIDNIYKETGLSKKTYDRYALQKPINVLSEKGYISNFAGYYIKDENIMINIKNLYSVEELELKLIQGLIGSEVIIFKDVKYSYQELEEIFNDLANDTSQIEGLRGISILEEQNMIQVTVIEETESLSNYIDNLNKPGIFDYVIATDDYQED